MADVASAGSQIQGEAAHDAAVAGNPVMVGGRADDSEPTAVADGDACWLWVDQQGRPVVVHSHPATVAADSTHGPKVVTLTGTGDTDLYCPGYLGSLLRSAKISHVLYFTVDLLIRLSVYFESAEDIPASDHCVGLLKHIFDHELDFVCHGRSLLCADSICRHGGSLISCIEYDIFRLS